MQLALLVWLKITSHTPTTPDHVHAPTVDVGVLQQRPMRAVIARVCNIKVRKAKLMTINFVTNVGMSLDQKEYEFRQHLQDVASNCLTKNQPVIHKYT